MTLILVCGLPGAGKTTLAMRLEAERNAIRLCPDDWIEAILEDPGDMRERDRLRDPMENLQWELAQSYLKKGLTVILENGFWSAEERGLYAIGAWDMGARVELAYVEAPNVEALWERVSTRNEALATETFRMTEAEVRAAWDLFEPPTGEELAFYDDAWTVPWSNLPAKGTWTSEPH